MPVSDSSPSFHVSTRRSGANAISASPERKTVVIQGTRPAAAAARPAAVLGLSEPSRTTASVNRTPCSYNSTCVPTAASTARAYTTAAAATSWIAIPHDW